MNKKEIYDKIEAYLLNQMSESERSDFEKELGTNEALKKQFNQQELEHQIMEVLVEKDLRLDLEKWQKEEDVKLQKGQKTRPKIFYLRRASMIAVAASLLFLVYMFFWWNERESDSIPIAKEEDHIEKSIPNEREDDEEKVEKNQSKQKNNQKEEPVKDWHTPSAENKYFALAESFSQPIDFSSEAGSFTRDGLTSMDSILINLVEGKIPSAKEVLEKKLKVDSTDQNVNYYLGLVYYHEKKI
jgi:hypothetical protein